MAGTVAGALGTSLAHAQSEVDLNDVLNETGWVERSRAADDLVPSIGFSLHDTTFVGDPFNSKQVLDPAHNPPVALPSFHRASKLFASASEVAGNEAELAAYYGRIVQMSGVPMTTERWRFALGLVLESSGLQAVIDFPYWQTLDDMDQFFAWIAGPGEEFLDVDQGWLFKASAKGDRFHFYHGGFDQGGEFENLSVEVGQFRVALAETRRQSAMVIAQLHRLTGYDVWSVRPDYPLPEFEESPSAQ